MSTSVFRLVSLALALAPLTACGGGGATIGGGPGAATGGNTGGSGTPGSASGGATAVPGGSGLGSGSGSGGSATASPSASPGGTGSPSPAPTSASVSTDERSCLWAAEISPSGVNTLFPDSGAYYFNAVVPIPAGGDVRFDGVYPHARYDSFNAYNPLLQPTDNLTDFQIAASGGSVNTAIAGANRNATARSYSIKLVQAAAPSDPTMRAANTLYGGQTVMSASAAQNQAVIIYRVYIPDIGRDDTGGVGLPHITFELANGTKVTGTQACSMSAGNGVPNLASVPDPVTALPANSSGATPNLSWLKFFDVQSSEAARTYETPLGPVAYETVGDPTSGSGGFASNADNRYIFASYDDAFGNVVAIHAQIPKTPRTYYGNATFGTGDMRYLSMCSNDTNATTSYACVYDEEIARDSQDRGIVLVSKAADRPANAYANCGVTWLDWGPNDQGTLIYRNMLPASKTQFPNAIQYIAGPPGTHEVSTMGPYYPYGTHMQKAAFEALGCPVSADALPSIAPSPPPGAPSPTAT